MRAYLVLRIHVATCFQKKLHNVKMAIHGGVGKRNAATLQYITPPKHK